MFSTHNFQNGIGYKTSKQAPHRGEGNHSNKYPKPPKQNHSVHCGCLNADGLFGKDCKNDKKDVFYARSPALILLCHAYTLDLKELGDFIEFLKQLLIQPS